MMSFILMAGTLYIYYKSGGDSVQMLEFVKIVAVVSLIRISDTLVILKNKIKE